MSLWITQDTVLGTLDQRPHATARWMMQRADHAWDGTVQIWSDDTDLQMLSSLRDMWIRRGATDTVITDMGDA
jgi:hypothetical protein